MRTSAFLEGTPIASLCSVLGSELRASVFSPFPTTLKVQYSKGRWGMGATAVELMPAGV